MRECRRRIDLDALLAQRDPGQAARGEALEPRGDGEPCMHFIAAYDRTDGRLGGMAEAVLWGLEGNRELAIRNLRPHEVAPARIDAVRADLEAVARRFAHEEAANGGGALFGDIHERNQVAREFATLILGPDPNIPPGAR